MKTGFNLKIRAGKLSVAVAVSPFFCLNTAFVPFTGGERRLRQLPSRFLLLVFVSDLYLDPFGSQQKHLDLRWQENLDFTPEDEGNR